MSASSVEEMASISTEPLEAAVPNGTTEGSKYRDLPHRSSNEALKAHSTFAVKLSETAVEFVQKLASVEEQHSQQLHSVVKAFKKKTAESFKKDPTLSSTSYFKAWEAMLDESDRQARSHTDTSQRYITSVSQHLSELTARKKHLMKKWYAFREVYMSRIDKSEDHVQKVFREYQDHWTRYAEGLEKGEGVVKDATVLRSYNAHNDYVLNRTAFNSLHEEFYNKQIYDMLDELQAIQEDLVKGFTHSLKSKVEIQQDKLKDSLKHLSNLMEVVSSISPPSDIAHFVGGQNIQVKMYPPPMAECKSPELPPPKLPDAPPVNLPSLSSKLQLVDLTQAPLMNIQEDLKKKETEVGAALDQLHKEYQSVKTLLSSYRENSALGDPNSLVEDLLQIRNKVRIKEVDLAMIRGKLSLFSGMNCSDGASPEGTDMYDFLENCDSSSSLTQQPRCSNGMLVVGRSHDFVDDERKFRIPVFCSYCDGMLQPPISRGVKCKVCKVTVHTKCQHYIPYCSGQPPVKNQNKASNHPKSAQPKDSPKFMPKVQKRFSWMMQKKTSSASSESIEDEEDETLGGIYEAPPLPPPKPSDKPRMTSPVHVPQPPPRGESLDPRQSMIEEALSHHSFEDTVELGVDHFSYCVALYNYSKVNPNDIDLESGEVLELINTFSSDWWKGTTANKKGYFPATYVQLISHGDVVMRAVYDFSPSSSGEMALEVGQIVVMTRNEGDGWLLGKSGDMEGLFPENYVEKLQAV